MYLFLYIQTNVTWNLTNLPFIPQRFLNSHDYDCSVSSLSPSPGLVRNFTINSFTALSSEITLNLSWISPSSPNGQLAPYNICIGAEPLEPQEEVQPNRGHFCDTADGNTHELLTFLFIKRPGHECLYVQVS